MLTLLMIPATPGILPSVGANTTVCNLTQLNWFASTRDFWFNALLTTCGTGNGGATVFTSTNHNMTFYCSTTYRGPADADCTDIKVQSYRLEFLGQYNLTTTYNSTTTTVQNPPESLDKYSTFSNSVDFARTYVKMVFLDKPPSGQAFGPFTLEAQSFVGTYTVFRIDWSDYDNNGTVDHADVNNASSYYGHPSSYWDYYAEGKVTILDIAIVSFYFGRSFNIPNFPGQGCAAQTFNKPSCQPVSNSLSALHPKWIDSCPIFPQPDQNYCNAHTS